MPDFEVTSPQGQKFQVTAPAGASQEDVLKYAQENFSKPPAPDESGPQPETTQRTGVANNAAAGGNEALAGLIGMPVDLITHGSKISDEQRAKFVAKNPAAAEKVDAYNAAIDNAIGGSNSIKKLFGLIGANPDDVKATTPGEHLARAAGEGAVSMVAPGMAAERVLAATWAKGDTLANAALNALKGTGPTSNAVIGAAAGAGGEAAAEAAPEPYKPIARLGGGVVAGVPAALGAGLVDAGVNAVKHTWRNMVEPAEVRAARIILDKASDPGAFRESLKDLPEEMVPGSKPTTGQATGDMGVLSYERGVQASPAGAAAFAERRAQQNAARLTELKSNADPSASAEAVTSYVEDRLREITALHSARVASAADDVAETLARAGGTEADNVTAYGEAIRRPLEELHKQAKREASALWRAIDPDMKTQVQVGGLKELTEKLTGDIPKLAEQPTGKEAGILDAIKGLDETASFGEIVALRSRITDAMREERRNGTPTVLRRLGMTLENLDSTLADTAGQLAADPARRGTMLERLALEVKQWQNKAKSDAATLEAPAGRGVSAGSEEPAAAGPANVHPAPGAESPVGERPGLSARDQGVQAGQPVEEVGGIPEDVAARYAAARAATKSMKQTFESGPVGAALKPGANAGSFSMLPSNVPKNLFDRPEALRAYVKASGGEAPIMQDYAAHSLRQAAVRDGSLNPAKYEKWVLDHQAQLRMFPELKEKLADVRMAQTVLDDNLAAQKEALTGFQKSAAQRFIGKDPVDAAGVALKDPKQFGELVDQVKDSAAATAGLKRAVVDHMLEKTLSMAEAGATGERQIKSDTLQRFIGDNKESLAKLFSADEIKSMENVATDLQRANRSTVATRIPGGSNTAQDSAAVAQHSMSFFEGMIHHTLDKVIGTAAGSLIGHPVLGFVVGTGLGALKAARMDTLQGAITEMMLNPKLAAAAMTKVPAEQIKSAGGTFASRLRALTANQITMGQMR